MSCLLKLKVTTSFCFPFKIPDDPTASIMYLHYILTSSLILHSNQTFTIYDSKSNWSTQFMNSALLHCTVWCVIVLRWHAQFTAILIRLNFVTWLHNKELKEKKENPQSEGRILENQTKSSKSEFTLLLKFKGILLLWYWSFKAEIV